jgi:segment polarity protein dishevelled
MENYNFLYFFLGLRVNGHGKGVRGYESSSMFSSDLETTSFLESEDDASSRITTTTGRATNLSIDRNTIGESIILFCIINKNLDRFQRGDKN